MIKKFQFARKGAKPQRKQRDWKIDNAVKLNNFNLKLKKQKQK